MGTVKHIGRIGAVAPGIRNVRRTATRMAVSIGVAALVVMSTVVPAPTVSPAVRLAASTAPCTQTDVTCALIMGTSGVPTPDDFYVESVKNQFIAPTHPGQIDYVKVTTPEELWPLGGIGRLVSLLGLELGDPEIFRAGGRRGTCRGGNSSGSSTSPSISQSCTGSPIWSRRWPSTPTTIG